MKVLTIFGTRPEIIRLSCIIQKLDNYCDQILVNTNQNVHSNLNGDFLSELGIRKPNFSLDNNSKNFTSFLGNLFNFIEKCVRLTKPDKALILGDTNSCLSSIILSRLSIPVYHLEAGNRCFDREVPEEINRKIIDHSSWVNLPYTKRSFDNLISEGFPANRIFTVGNPILEVINHYSEYIEKSDILQRLALTDNQYLACTIHRAELVDNPKRLSTLLDNLSLLAKDFNLPVILSCHPRTQSKIQQFDLKPKSNIKVINPLGFFDFIKLEQKSKLILTDSGTVQEEGCIFGLPNITLRNVTERPETLESGSNLISGIASDDFIAQCRLAVEICQPQSIPIEYTKKDVSTTVTKIVMSTDYYG